jgi:putative transposase
MPKRFTPEQIIAKLRQIEVQLAQGKSVALACKDAAISEQSYFRWRKEYGGVPIEQAKRLKNLERENARLRRLVADLSLEKQILKDYPRETCKPRAAPPGSDTHPGEVRPLRAPRLPYRLPTSWDTALCAHSSG